MMVIQAGGVIYPADRCTWEQGEAVQNQSTGRVVSYEINNAVFYNGVDASGTDLTGAELGYISKTGRFVKMTG